MMFSHQSRWVRYQSMVLSMPSANFVYGSQPNSLWIFVGSMV